MIKKILGEPVKYREKYLSTNLLTKAEVEHAMDRVVEQVRQNMVYIGGRCPTPAAKDGSYGVIDNIEWTDGFWTGLLWLCYEYSGDAAFRGLAERNVESFLTG